MDKKVIWTEQSYKDIDSICDYIKRDSNFYTYSFIDKIFEAGDSLEKFSHRERVVPETLQENIREIFIFDYRLIYRIQEDVIEILTVIHGKRIVKKKLKNFKKR